MKLYREEEVLKILPKYWADKMEHVEITKDAILFAVECSAELFNSEKDAITEAIYSMLKGE